MKYYLNIGSNLGNRHENISHAVKALETALKSTITLSTAISSTAWGYCSENTFLNVGAAFGSNLSPHEVLSITQNIERELGSATHRNADGSYCDRLIDIDIIAVDNLTINTPELILPHPRMHLREFVLRPMVELAPLWKHPILHKTPQQLLSMCKPGATDTTFSSCANSAK